MPCAPCTAALHLERVHDQLRVFRLYAPGYEHSRDAAAVAVAVKAWAYARHVRHTCADPS